MKITVHDEMRIFFAFHIENNFAKTMLHGYLMKITKITITGKKNCHFAFQGKQNESIMSQESTLYLHPH